VSGYLGQVFGLVRRFELPARPIVGQFAGLSLVVVLFAFLTRDTGTYLTQDNLRTIAVQTAIIGICGVGMTLVIIGGGIDLSVGSTVALVTITIALVHNGEFTDRIKETAVEPLAVWVGATAAGPLDADAQRLATRLAIGLIVAGTASGVLLLVFLHRRPLALGMATTAAIVLACWLFSGQGPYYAVAAGILAGIVCGICNGIVITATRVVPFIVTLGTMTVYRGAAQLLAQGESVGVARTPDWLRGLMESDPKPSSFIVAPGVWIMLFAGLVAAVLLAKLPLGRYMVAIGSNEEAARLSGIATNRVKIWMYGLAGLMFGLAGVMTFSRLSFGDSTSARGLELDVIAAVVIGGGSLRGGEGSVLGTFIGAFIMGFMRNGCDHAGISTWVQQILVGTVIILAVALDELRHRRIG
jgi:ribose/xylose/arabinose/galactoside ABC-type transport system permease subunit